MLVLRGSKDMNYLTVCDAFAHAPFSQRYAHQIVDRIALPRSIAVLEFIALLVRHAFGLIPSSISVTLERFPFPPTHAPATSNLKSILRSDDLVQ